VLDVVQFLHDNPRCGERAVGSGGDGR
jgi:hypothetical protein